MICKKSFPFLVDQKRRDRRKNLADGVHLQLKEKRLNQDGLEIVLIKSNVFGELES